tara:strand:- start:722 stop:1318 length:597 start_codon:yes stop_codon:yes gene_type:complete
MEQTTQSINKPKATEVSSTTDQDSELTTSPKKDNPMRKIFIEKVLLSSGATSDDLQKSVKLLQLISDMKPQILKSNKRIPDFNVRPGLEVGTRVTIRGKKAEELLKKLLPALENTLDVFQVSDNHFSFGIKEYIEIPGIEYQRDIGIRGFNITVVFARPGFRVKRKKIKSGKLPKKQHISKQEIIDFMKQNFKTEFLE